MSIIIKIITELEYLISPESFLLLYFTMLGILVTLISISSSLTKEVRQDLFFNYYIKSRFLMTFFLFYIVSFLIAFIASVGNFDYLNPLLSIFFTILFVWSVVIVFIFVKNLSRKWFYSQLINKFKLEIKKARKVQDKYQTHTRTQSKYLDDFLKNLSYIEMTSSDFIEEIEFIKEIGRNTLKSNKSYIFNEFFDQLKKVENPRFFRKLRNSLYDLMWDYFLDLRTVINLQNIYTLLSIHCFSKVKEFDKSLNTDGLRIKSFFDIRYVDTFKKTSNEEWIKDYTGLAVNTINNLFNLCKQIIYLDVSLKTKKRYLTEQLSSMVKSLEYYDHVHGQDFLENYYDLKYKKELSEDDKKNLELADEKLKAIEDLKEALWTKISELFYLILYEIDLGELQKDFFEIALRIFKIKDFKKYYYQYDRFDKLDFLNYDWFEGGAQAIAPFNFSKYKLLLSLYQYAQTDKLDINQYGNEHFSKHNVTTFKKEVESLNSDFVSKYFGIDNKKLTTFKKKVKKEVDNRVKTLKKNKKQYIVRTPLKREYVDQFISDCKSYWEENQTILKKFLKYVEKENGKTVRTFFGQYSLFGKEWFLDSFDKTVSLDRSSGKNFGRDQVISKRKAVLSKIDELFTKNLDKEIIIKDLYADLKKVIGKNKEYFLFYNSDLGREIYKIPDIKWERQDWLTAWFEINNSKVYLYHANIENSLLFEKNSFILEQFKEGYENIKEPFVVQIEEIKDKKEIENIKKSGDKFKTDEEIQQNVKIRLAEKFDVKRNNKSSFVRLKI